LSKLQAPTGGLRRLKSVMPIIAAVLLFSAFLNLLTLTVPLYMLQIYDRVVTSGSIPTLVMLTIMAGVCLMLFAGFDVVRGRLVSRASIRIERTLGPKALECSIAAAAERGSVKSSQPLRDLQEVRGFVASPGFLAFVDVPWVPAYTVLIFLMHPALGAVALVGALALAEIGVMSEVMGRRLQLQAREASAQAGRRVEGYIRHADVIRAMGLMRFVEARWKSDVAAAFSPMGKAADRAILMAGLARMVRAGLQIALLGTGVVLVLRQQITVGQTTAASVLAARAFAPLEQAIGSWRALLSARAAWGRLKSAMDLLPQPGSKLALPAPEGHLSVQSVSLRQPGRGRPLLEDISLEIPAGEVIGITGASGAGKSTLARMLVGLETPTEGAIRLDGAELADWQPEQLGAAIGYLPQTASLFPGTIAENIAALDEEANPEWIVEAAKLTGTHDMILALPGGYNAEVGWDGEFLSAGQRQRVGLARAFYGDRRLIVLDEPNANLDPAGDAALAAAVTWARRHKRTVILVTHRREILAKVDRIVLIDQGRLVKVGRPAPSVIASNPASRAASTVTASAAVTDHTPRRVVEKARTHGPLAGRRTPPREPASSTPQRAANPAKAPVKLTDRIALVRRDSIEIDPELQVMVKELQRALT